MTPSTNSLHNYTWCNLFTLDNLNCLNCKIYCDWTKRVRRHSIASIVENDFDARRVLKEMRPPTEEDVFNKRKVQQKIKDLYFEFRDAVVNLGSDIKLRAKTDGITFRRNANFMAIYFKKDGQRIHLRPKDSKFEFSDPKGIVKPLSKGDWWTISLTEPDLIPYVLDLVKVTYEKN